MMAAGLPGIPGRGTLCGCNGVFNKIAVLHDGIIVPCHNLSTMRLGIVGEDDLRHIWLEHPTMYDLRRRQQVPLSSLDTCCDCPYQGFCTGGCPRGALLESGSINARDPGGCLRIFKGEDPYYQLDDI